MAHPCVAKRPGSPCWSPLLIDLPDRRQEGVESAALEPSRVAKEAMVRWKSHAGRQLDGASTPDARSDALICLFPLLHHRRLGETPSVKNRSLRANEFLSLPLRSRMEVSTLNETLSNLERSSSLRGRLLVWTWTQKPPFNNGEFGCIGEQIHDALAALIGSNEKMLDRVLMYWETYATNFLKRALEFKQLHSGKMSLR